MLISSNINNLYIYTLSLILSNNILFLYLAILKQLKGRMMKLWILSPLDEEKIVSRV